MENSEIKPLATEMHPQGSIGPIHHSDDGGHQPISIKHRKRDCMSCNTRAYLWHTLLCNEYGEDKFVLMFGGLHIEMTAMKSIGSILEDSGWTCALVEADVASSGTADSFLSATNVTRTRQAHQITACSLFQLMKKAYIVHLAEHPSNNDKDISFENWCGARKKESP